MAKRVNSLSLKGVMELDFNSGVGTVTEVTKNDEKEYDLFALMQEFDGKSVTISIKEENEIPTVDGE